MRNNFIEGTHKKTNLFDLKSSPIKYLEEELLAIEYVFEACFLCDDSRKAHYLVISANLKPEFREKVANEVIRILYDLIPEETIMNRNTININWHRLEDSHLP